MIDGEFSEEEIDNADYYYDQQMDRITEDIEEAIGLGVISKCKAYRMNCDASAEWLRENAEKIMQAKRVQA